MPHPRALFLSRPGVAAAINVPSVFGRQARPCRRQISSVRTEAGLHPCRAGVTRPDKRQTACEVCAGARQASCQTPGTFSSV